MHFLLFLGEKITRLMEFYYKNLSLPKISEISDRRPKPYPSRTSDMKKLIRPGPNSGFVSSRDDSRSCRALMLGGRSLNFRTTISGRSSAATSEIDNTQSILFTPSYTRLDIRRARVYLGNSYWKNYKKGPLALSWAVSTDCKSRAVNSKLMIMDRPYLHTKATTPLLKNKKWRKDSVKRWRFSWLLAHLFRDCTRRRRLGTPSRIKNGFFPFLQCNFYIRAIKLSVQTLTTFFL